MPMSIKVQGIIGAGISDEQLAFIREMGIEYVNLNIGLEHCDYGSLCEIKKKTEKHGIIVSDIACVPLQKNAAIDLGLPERDAEIQKFNEFVKASSQAGIPIVSIAWQPNGILRTGWGVGEHTRGGISMYADMEEIVARPYANGRAFGEQEIWDNFSYFMERTIPVCEKAGVRMALHPNDPPVSCLVGVHSLIHNTECYRKAFALVDNSPALAMKMCVGCWLEGGDAFGNLMEDIKEFCEKDQIVCVHLRNVSATIPYFEETLAEDGYAEMYAIVKQFVRCSYNGLMSIDHAFRGYPTTGGRIGSFAYPTGYLKGMIYAAEQELA